MAANNSTGTQLTPTQKKQVGTLRDMLEASKAQISLALPRHLTPERMIRVAMTSVQQSPALLDCSPLSVLSCIIQASQLGLELTGALGQAYMIPRKLKGQPTACFQVGYRGLRDLAFRSGRVKSFPAHVVYENDFFDFAYGTDLYLKHKPTFGDPGKPICVYASVNLLDGGCDFEVWSVDKVNAHRARYSKDSRDDSAWNTAWDAMACKTLVIQLAKRVPVSVEFQRAAIADEYGREGIEIEAGVLQAPIKSATETLQEKLAKPEAIEAPATDSEPEKETTPEPAMAGAGSDEF